jgi:hypothetical protein
MKHVLFEENVPAETTEVKAPEAAETFRCPNCVMGATCNDCSMYSSSGYCRKYGGYSDPDHWACSWYYTS